jgi:hypothetical protein
MSSETVTIRTKTVLNRTIAADAFLPALMVELSEELTRRARAPSSPTTSGFPKAPPCPHGPRWAEKFKNHQTQM